MNDRYSQAGGIESNGTNGIIMAAERARGHHLIGMFWNSPIILGGNKFNLEV